MKSDVPKQYLAIQGKSVLEHAITQLGDVPGIRGVLVCIAPDDAYWRRLGINHPKLLGTVTGGVTRAESVMNGLRGLAQYASRTDWVLVHDAVRPCVRTDSIQALMEQASSDVGGLLAVPIMDSIKREDENGRVANSVDREGLWLAQTPQLFRIELLQRALQQATVDNVNVTDEAGAVEHLGYRPRLVLGRRDNIKITEPHDLELAAQYLRMQRTGESRS